MELRAQSLVAALDRDGQMELAMALPPDILAAALGRMASGEVVSPASAPEEAAAEAVEAVAAEAPELVSLDAFLNPDAKIPAEQQLAFMDKFYADRRLNVASLSAEQLAHLAQVLEENPHMRVVPTPLLELHRLSNVGWDGKGHATLSGGRDGSFLKKIVDNKSMPTKKGMMGGATYGVYYHQPGVGLVDHAGMVKRLTDNGQAVTNPDTGLAWAFPVVDVRVRVKPERMQPYEAHQAVDSALMPGTVMAIRMLHEDAGQGDDHKDYDVCNAAIYKIDQGQPVEPEAVIAVYRDRKGSFRLHGHDLSGYDVSVGPAAFNGLHILSA